MNYQNILSLDNFKEKRNKSYIHINTEKENA